MNTIPYIEGAIEFIIIMAILDFFPKLFFFILSSSVISSTSILFNFFTRFTSK